jgi:hypothetical protein
VEASDSGTLMIVSTNMQTLLVSRAAERMRPVAGWSSVWLLSYARWKSMNWSGRSSNGRCA